MIELDEMRVDQIEAISLLRGGVAVREVFGMRALRFTVVLSVCVVFARGLAVADSLFQVDYRGTGQPGGPNV